MGAAGHRSIVEAMSPATTTRIALMIVVALGLTGSRAGAQSLEGARNTLGKARKALQSEAVKSKARLAGKIANNALRRARRSYVIGPDTGAAFRVNTDGDTDVVVSGGASFTSFDIDIVPDERALFDFARERATALLTKRVQKSIANGKRPTNEELEVWARETGDRVIEEVLERLEPRRFEKPQYAVRLEGTYLIRQTAGEVRLTGSLGLVYAFLSTGLVLGIDESKVDLLVPIEVSVPIALTMTPWSPLVEGFVRVDIPTTGRDRRSEAFLLGVRFVMDVI